MADKIDLYFHDYKLTIETNEFGYSDRNNNDVKERQEETKEANIWTYNKNLNKKTINEIRKDIKELSKNLR